MPAYWDVPLPVSPLVPATFLPVWQWTIRVERGPGSGKVDDPADLGGRTKDGITQATFNAWNAEHGRPPRDVWTITDRETAEIYLVNYWQRARCDLIDDRTDRPDRLAAPRLALVHYDGCVNHGIRGVTKTGRVYGAAVLLQEVLGVTPDGWVGKLTLAAIDRAVGVDVCRDQIPESGWGVVRDRELAVCDRLLERRRQYYEAIIASKPKQAKFRRGWMARLDVLGRLIRTL